MVEAQAQFEPAPASELPWSQVWHLPVLLLGLGLFAMGVYLSMPEQKPRDFASELDDVASYMSMKNYEKARAALDAIEADLELVPDDQKGRFWQYWADYHYERITGDLLVDVKTENMQANRERIAGWYEMAERRYGRELDVMALLRWARTLVSLNRVDEALKVVDRLQDAPPWRRYGLVRSLIERERADGGGKMDRLVPLIERFKRELRTETDPQRRREQEIWVYGLEAALLTENGDPKGAVDSLVELRLPRLVSGHARGGEAPDLAPLYVTLAQAYQQVPALDRAESWYRNAQRLLDSASGLNAEVLVGLGEVTLQKNDPQSIEQAAAYFAKAVRSYPSEPTIIEALSGLAHCEAMRNYHAEATEHFGMAVERLLEHDAGNDRRAEQLSARIRTHVDRLGDLARHEDALAYLGLLKRLHAGDLPEALLLDLAVTHERIGHMRLKRAQSFDPRRPGEREPEQLLAAQKQANQQAALSFEQAARYYRKHAAAVSRVDDDAHGESLWRAAVSFDRAQLWSEAISVYAQYVRDRGSDPRQLEARARLGLAYLADGQQQAAIEQFLHLEEQHPTSPVTQSVLVPLARAFDAIEQSDAAERTLLRVVEDHEAITPDSTVYREALVELGSLYYRLGEQDPQYYARAIERLEAAVQRYGREPGSAKLRFMLADSLRESVAGVDERMDGNLSQRDVLDLQVERENRLEQAQILYNQVITELDEQPQVALTTRERLYLRNAYFYQADCAYDRGQFEVAIDLYDQAARRWQDHPASLVALVQIVNARCELGQFQQARAANANALGQLERIPDEAFEDPSLPMNRQHWEDWLRWTSELNLYKQQQVNGAPAREG